MNKNSQIYTKQKNEGLYLLDWIAWHQAINIGPIHIVSNDCTDHSDTLLDAISEEVPGIHHFNVTDEPLSGRSIGQRATSKLNELISTGILISDKLVNVSDISTIKFII